MWFFFFKGQELPLQYFKSFKLCLKNISLNSDKPYQNWGTHCDWSLSLSSLGLGLQKECRCPIVSDLLPFAQSGCCPTSSKFSWNYGECWDTSISKFHMVHTFWSGKSKGQGHFTTDMSKMQRMGHVPVTLPNVCERNKKGVKGRGRFLF